MSTPTKKAAKPRKPSAHPPFADLIKEAIVTLKEVGVGVGEGWGTG